jgi:hypothetical protein
MPLIRGIHLGAKTLLAHFHYICKGQKPFEIDWGQQPLSKAAQRMANLSHNEVDFMTSLSQLAQEKGEWTTRSRSFQKIDLELTSRDLSTSCQGTYANGSV